jgi:hypothetical protein
MLTRFLLVCVIRRFGLLRLERLLEFAQWHRDCLVVENDRKIQYRESSSGEGLRVFDLGIRNFGSVIVPESALIEIRLVHLEAFQRILTDSTAVSINHYSASQDQDDWDDSKNPALCLVLVLSSILP